jgi:prophage regulatory protein
MATTEMRKNERAAERESKRERRRRLIAEARQRAMATLKASGTHRVWRLPEVEMATGLTRTSIYEGIEEGTFPPPIPLGERAVGWLEEEIMCWLEERIAERNEKRRVDSGLEAPA